MDPDLIKDFSRNRAEEFPIDVWGLYVLPPQYDSINLANFDKAVMVEGGRGSGKTMFLRYHCHDTRLSPNRRDINAEELSKIGLYFRPDTHFCSSITSNIYGSDWEKVFAHYFLINVIKELGRFTQNLSKCDFSFNFDGQASFSEKALPNNFSERVGNQKATSFSELVEISDKSLQTLNDWVNDPDSFPRPKFPDARSVIESLIGEIKSSPELSSSKFIVYIDEFENLTVDQQRLLNTWIKHGTENLIISAAYKKYGAVSRETYSNESLVLRNDYRKIDLEDFSDEDFKIFAAEVLYRKLLPYFSDGFAAKKTEDILVDEDSIGYRASQKYKDQITEFARRFLPSTSYEAIAEEILEDPTLRKRLTDFLIKPALNDVKKKPVDFVSDNYPVESLLNGVLLNRKNSSPDDIFKNFEELKLSGKNDFYKPYRDVLVGVILWIYISAGRRNIPIYSGFDRICLMARSNLRHVLEFCHQCLVEQRKDTDIKEDIFVPIKSQATAARKNSEQEVEKVVELGRYGNNLRFIVNRLGVFFQLLQKRKSQSEPEVAHFGIEVATVEKLPEDIRVLLDELKVWSVLIEYSGSTKKKSHLDLDTHEYMLHPMFSPNFSITFRKIRKHMFSVSELKVIFCGSEREFVELCKPYASRVSDRDGRDIQTVEDIQGSLFDEV